MLIHKRFYHNFKIVSMFFLFPAKKHIYDVFIPIAYKNPICHNVIYDITDRVLSLRFHILICHYLVTVIFLVTPAFLRSSAYFSTTAFGTLITALVTIPENTFFPIFLSVRSFDLMVTLYSFLHL